MCLVYKVLLCLCLYREVKVYVYVTCQETYWYKDAPKYIMYLFGVFSSLF